MEEIEIRPWYYLYFSEYEQEEEEEEAMVWIFIYKPIVSIHGILKNDVGDRDGQRVEDVKKFDDNVWCAASAWMVKLGEMLM